jgi:hypothetical protein
MYGDRKAAWDIVPDMNEARVRSLKHLTTLATDVVRTVLGPSPQAAETEAEEDRYRRAVQDWNEQDRQRIQELSRPYPERAVKTEVDLDAWLRKKIAERLLHHIDSIILDLIGIEMSFGAYRLKGGGGSTLGQRLVEKAKAFAVELADKWVADNASSVPKEMKIEDLHRHYKYDLEKATKAAIEARIVIIANERAEHIRTDVLEAAVDKAMFDSYPILRRMEAAERLGAKTEAE